MSLASWKREFYRTPANKVSKRYALRHSLKKWIGLKLSNRKKRNVFLDDIVLMDKSGNRLPFDTTTCALCKHHRDDCFCSGCPLLSVNNETRCYDLYQPYDQFMETLSGDFPVVIKPMIALLQKALKFKERT